MKLHLVRFKEETKLISEPQTVKELWNNIKKYLESINYRSYYTRHWIEDNGLFIDYGSHTSFLKVTEMTVEDMRDLYVTEEIDE